VLRCFSSQQAKIGLAGSSCARISTPPRENRACRGPEPAAQGKDFFGGFTARLRRPSLAGSLWPKRSSHPNKPKPGLLGTPVKSCPDTCLVGRDEKQIPTKPLDHFLWCSVLAEKYLSG